MAVSFPSMRKLGGDMPIHIIKTVREVTNLYAKRQVDSSDPSHPSPHKKPYLCETPEKKCDIRIRRKRVRKMNAVRKLELKERIKKVNEQKEDLTGACDQGI